MFFTDKKKEPGSMAMDIVDQIGKDEGNPEEESAELVASSELLQAIVAKDPKAIKEALHSFVHICMDMDYSEENKE